MRTSYFLFFVRTCATTRMPNPEPRKWPGGLRLESGSGIHSEATRITVSSTTAPARDFRLTRNDTNGLPASWSPGFAGGQPRGNHRKKPERGLIDAFAVVLCTDGRWIRGSILGFFVTAL